MEQIIAGKLYSTDKATMVATDYYWDGYNYDRNGRTCELYKTDKGSFFLYHSTSHQGERDYIETVGINVAKESYETLLDHKLTWLEAFGEEVEIG